MILEFNNKKPIIAKSSFIAQNTNIIGDVKIGKQTSIWFGTTIRADMNYIHIGDRTNIQDNSIVHVTTKIAPTVIGNGVTIGHGAIIHGCTIENNCLIGMGSIIMDEAIIKEGSMIAAGAIVTPKTIVPKNTLMLGTPAKPIRKLSNDEYSEILDRAQHYIDFSEKYKK